MRNQGLTLVEVLVLIVLVAILVGMVDFGSCARATEEARKANCKENLSQVGLAMANYAANNDDYFPFTWGPANGTCSKAPGSTDVCDAATSLGCLYPQYINKPRIFRCPSTEDRPSFVLKVPQGVASPDAQAYLWKNRNWTLKGNLPGRASSYGYDPRIYPAAVGKMAIMGDWDGSYFSDHDTTTQNHSGGQNVLYVDGSVKWQQGNYVSNDPIDDIYVEGGMAAPGKRVYWNADTDSFLVNGATALTRSYDGYPALQR
jgi:prepilin-type processing-associated H-X9-DG protein